MRAAYDSFRAQDLTAQCAALSRALLCIFFFGCACTGGVFHDCYNVLGGVDKAIPVDVYAPGCAVRPETIIDAVVAGVAALDEKSKALKAKKKEA